MSAGSAVPTWYPQDHHLERSRLLDLCRRAGVADRAGLDALARRDPVAFWGLLASWVGLRWEREPTSVVDDPALGPAVRWFPDGRANVVDSALLRWVDEGRGDEVALLWEDEDGRTGSSTYRQLVDEVAAVAAGLGRHGVRSGDRVGVQLPMCREAAVAQLALAWLGAVAVPVFSGFGAEAVADRLRLAGASALVVADGVRRRGRVLGLRTSTEAVLDAAPEVSLCVTVPVAGADGEVEPLRGETSWDDVRTAGADHVVPPAACPTDHPLMVAYTSGTTGRPKGVVLGHAGFGLKAGTDVAMLFDAGPGDVAAWVTDPGWVMHPITLLGGLVAGAAVALVDGAPDWPAPTRLWESVERLGISVLGVSPTLVRTLMAQDAVPAARPPSLRVLASSGEPWTSDAYAWLHLRVGRGELPVINYSGGTEVSGAILSNTVTEPVVPCAFAGPVPGMAAAVLDDGGRPVALGVGELALLAPSPGMPLGFWGEPGRYERTYWNRWPGVWAHGDWAEQVEDGHWFVHGRSDDTLKVAGKRLGPAEVEDVVNGVDGVLESAAVGVPDPVKGSALVVFARTADDTDPDAVRASVVARVQDALGRPLRPAAVHVVDDLPRTRSGKILRRLVLQVHLGHDTSGSDASLANPSALDALRSPR